MSGGDARRIRGSPITRGAFFGSSGPKSGELTELADSTRLGVAGLRGRLRCDAMVATRNTSASRVASSARRSKRSARSSSHLACLCYCIALPLHRIAFVLPCKPDLISSWRSMAFDVKLACSRKHVQHSHASLSPSQSATPLSYRDACDSSSRSHSSRLFIVAR